ncbi:MAG TPA: hypothetical protein VM346_06865 [Sphingomicrobium sp.]|nr:hypothetical protein [Sphingomicrobium sp.]
MRCGNRTGAHRLWWWRRWKRRSPLADADTDQSDPYAHTHADTNANTDAYTHANPWDKLQHD